MAATHPLWSIRYTDDTGRDRNFSMGGPQNANDVKEKFMFQMAQGYFPYPQGVDICMDAEDEEGCERTRTDIKNALRVTPREANLPLPENVTQWIRGMVASN